MSSKKIIAGAEALLIAFSCASAVPVLNQGNKTYVYAAEKADDNADVKKDDNIQHKIPFDTIGKITETISYTLNEEGTLLINGTGIIPDANAAGGLFSQNNDIKNIIISEGITRIGSFLFTGNYSLESVKLPETLESIGDNAFAMCRELKSITIPKNVSRIGNRAFIDCHMLKLAEFQPYNIEIGYAAFGYYDAGKNEKDQEILINNDNLVIKGYPASDPYSYSYANNVTFTQLEDKVTAEDALGISSGYKLYDSGLLLITGTGIVPDYESGKSPLNDIKKSINRVVIADGITEIGNNLFEDFSEISSVKIPKSAARIGIGCFKGCTGLTEIKIPEGNKTIAEDAFNGCTGIKSLSLPSTVAAIGNKAFWGCSELNKIYIWSEKARFGTDVFGFETEQGSYKDKLIICAPADYSAGSYAEKNELRYEALTGSFGDNITYSIDENRTLTISGTGDIPDYDLNSKPFNMVFEIYNIEIEEGITGVGDYLFYCMNNIRRVNLPDTVKRIGCAAFTGCSNLYSVNLPDSLETIEDYAFENCDSLERISVPQSVKKVGECAFNRCDNLKRLCLWSFDAEIGDMAFGLTHDKTDADKVYDFELWGYKDSSAYYYCQVNSLHFREAAAKISDNIEYRIYPSGDLEISGKGEMPSYKQGSSVFYLDDFLRKNIRYIYILNGVTSVGDNAFQHIPNLNSVYLPHGMTKIGDKAFRWCGNLRYINIPYGVESIGESAFASCSELGNVFLSDTVKEIGPEAFMYCDKLENVSVSGVENVGESAFIGCSSIKKLEFSKKLESIGKQAFALCTSLSRADLSVSVKEIGESAFTDCSALKELELPKSVKNIGTKAFYNCEILKRVTVNSDDAVFGDYSFGYHGGDFDADYYTDFQLSGHKNSTAESYAQKNHLLFNVLAGSESNQPAVTTAPAVTTKPVTTTASPEATKPVTTTAAPKPTAVPETTKPAVTTAVQNTAEPPATNGNPVTTPSVTVTTKPAAGPAEGATESGKISENISYAVYKDGTLRISGTGDLPDYTNDKNSPFREMTTASYVVIEEGITGIGDYLFFGNKTIESVSLPDSLTKIGESAFAETNIKSVSMPDSVSELGKSAFQNCTMLEKVKLSNNLREIPAYAFNKCTSLEEIEIPDSVKTVGEEAFVNCKNLKDISVPYGMKLDKQTDSGVNITVRDGLTMDVDDNGIINMHDFIALRNCILNSGSSSESYNADVNKDGIVDVKDLMELRVELFR